MNDKEWWQSKTIWVQVLGVVALVLASKAPGVSAFIQEHFAAAGGAWALINIVLRVVTKKEIA